MPRGPIAAGASSAYPAARAVVARSVPSPHRQSPRSTFPPVRRVPPTPIATNPEGRPFAGATGSRGTGSPTVAGSRGGVAPPGPGAATPSCAWQGFASSEKAQRNNARNGPGERRNPGPLRRHPPNRADQESALTGGDQSASRVRQTAQQETEYRPRFRLAKKL